MIDLNNLDEIKKMDPKNVLGSVEMFLDQCRQIWEEAKQLQYPDEYKNCQNIVVCGMGGSRYGAYVVKSLYSDSLPVPFLEYGDYHLPAFVGKESLFILSSYSGGTEEPLNSAKEAAEKGFPIIGLTSGGEALEISKKYKFPTLLFEPKYNPSGQPRLGMGYMVLGVVAILVRLGFISVGDDEVANAISEVRNSQDEIKYKAKEFAQKICGSIPVIFAAEFLSGNAHIMRNQFNETAKSFSTFSPLPELNHHLLEGLKNPPDKKFFVLFINSNLYSDRLSKRVELTKDVVGKNNVSFDEYKPAGSTRLSQVLNVLSFGGYLTYYLAMLYGQDPSVIPWVDYFKAELAKT